MPGTPPADPAGEFLPADSLTEQQRRSQISVIARAPGFLKAAVLDLTAEQLNTRYINWSIRQIVHHLADSHVHSYIRFKFALTELNPTIKPYDETATAELPDSRLGDVAPALALFDGIHSRWLQLLQSMNAEQFSRTFFHPATGQTVTLDRALSYYAWHCRHHTAQIEWLRRERAF
jgi:uncharacterized damage-inducible protein DinB